ncbi:MAG TPA: NlpC/P60 family protein [Chitinophagaceae bacterium]|nr:NlpC/P60 family protein [Chitinophagaceae bacterium]
MVKQILPALAFILFLSSCSTFKPLSFTSNKQVVSVATPSPQTKFIDDISVTPQTADDKTEVNSGPKESFSTRGLNMVETQPVTEAAKKLSDIDASRDHVNAIENASAVQLKYAVLLNTEVESLPAKTLLESVDSWYGVRYRTGGNGKTGIDCSGFTVAVYLAAYGICLPRVSREQYRISRKVSTTELQEGDLLFFNTRGSGVSHVGVYLGNNKFIHATVSKGVMVNDLFESYYVKRFIGAGRIDDKQAVASN